jgi:beta-glucanase (GH16 family)
MMLRRALLALPVASACQLAKSSPPEQRLEPVRAPLALAALPAYQHDTHELLPPTLTQGPQAFSGLSTTLLAGKLTAGKAYRLKVTARSAGNASLAVKFREPNKRESFRTFSVSITGEPARQYLLELTAPAYAQQAELVVDARSGSLSVESLSLSERAPLPQTEPVSSWSGSFVPPGYALVFNDEFSGSTLNRSKWFTRYIYSSETLDRLNDENQRYADNDNHRVKAGILYLVAKRNKLSKPSGVNYESGMIRSDFTVRYGFFEARVKMPAGLGVWPAFWVNSDVSESGKLSHPPEIDFFEFVNNGKDDKLSDIHSAATKDPEFPTRFSYEHPSFKPSIQRYRAPFNFSDGFHTIGAEWTPEELSVYVDGLKLYTRNFRWLYKDGSLAGPAHVLLNLAIGGQWAGRYGIDDSAFPQALAIDWVRVYQKP